MSVIARHGTHELRTVTDHLGRHHQCSCTMFSVNADVKQVQEGRNGPYTVVAPPTPAQVLARWQAHIDLLRMSCDMPWRTRRTA